MTLEGVTSRHGPFIARLWLLLLLCFTQLPLQVLDLLFEVPDAARVDDNGGILQLVNFTVAGSQFRAKAADERLGPIAGAPMSSVELV
jgi:hypothetical protein